jgi:ABC-type transport system substrate-binding protein
MDTSSSTLVPPQSGVQTRGKSIRVGVLSGISVLDPREATDNISGLILGQIYEAPYTISAGSTTVTPLLFAEALKPEPGRGNRPVYSAAVRPGVAFSDGTPLTAELVVRSLRSSKALSNKAEVEARGERVFFTLSGPNPRFELTLTQGNCAIVLEKNGQMLGTGPFMFPQRPVLRTLQSANAVVLQRNPHARMRYIDEVVFKVYPADKDGSPTALAEAFRKGEVDVTSALTLPEVSRYQLGSVQPSLQPGNSTGILFFNTTRISSAVVRRAVATAIDLHKIADCCFERNPIAFVATTLLPPMMGRVTGVPRQSPTEAKRLFEEAGAAKPRRLTLLVPWSPRPYMPKPLLVAQSIQRQLAAFDVQVDLVETTTAERFFGDLTAGHYDLALAGWIADTPDPADFFEALLWSRMAEGEHHSNHSHWKDGATDVALQRFRESPTEANRSEIFRIIHDQAPLLPLIYGQSVVVHTRKIRNVTVSSTGVISLGAADVLD